ncbi:MAG: hypothetical protein V3T83_22335 [Acidobacteriota bacterium]
MNSPPPLPAFRTGDVLKCVLHGQTEVVALRRCRIGKLPLGLHKRIIMTREIAHVIRNYPLVVAIHSLQVGTAWLALRMKDLGIDVREHNRRFSQASNPFLQGAEASGKASVRGGPAPRDSEGSGARKRRSLEDRLMALVRREQGHWLWQGTSWRGGKGMAIWVDGKQQAGAGRLGAFQGSSAEDLQADPPLRSAAVHPSRLS